MASDHVVTAFTEEQVSRLTGISRNQLRHWDRTGFFSPSLGDENRRLALSRTYTFRDVVSLRVLHTLRNEVRIPLPHLREVKDNLSHVGDDFWAKTTLYVLGRRVVVDNPQNPEGGERVDAASGQAVLEIPIHTICAKTQKAVEEMWGRDADTIGRFNKQRGLAHSEHVVAGTRVPTRSIRAFLEAGYSTDAILEEYPSLTTEDVDAVRRLGTAA
jgi:DNA-binding transcriptional MerR regulator